MSSEKKTLPTPSPTDSIPSASRNIRDLMLPRHEDHEAPALPKQQAPPLPPTPPPRFPVEPKKITFKPRLTGIPKSGETQDKASKIVDNWRQTLESIRKGVKLRKVEPKDLKPKEREELQLAVNARRTAVASSESGSDNEEDQGSCGWDEEA